MATPHDIPSDMLDALRYSQALVESLSDIKPFIVKNVTAEDIDKAFEGASASFVIVDDLPDVDISWNASGIFDAVDEEEIMTEKLLYLLRNGMKAEIDEFGNGRVIDTGHRTAWIPAEVTQDIYFNGGVNGHDYDAISWIGYPEAPQTLYAYISPNQKENTMSENRDGFVTIDYHNGYPIKDLTDDQIFERIREEQKKLDALSKVPEGAAATAHKERIQTNIDKLTAAVNGRYE